LGDTETGDLRLTTTTNDNDGRLNYDNELCIGNSTTNNRMNTLGYALITKLRADADDCQRPDRAELLRDAADEIERLIQELKESLNSARDTKRQTPNPQARRLDASNENKMKNKTSGLTVNDVDVTITWEDRSGGRPGQRSAGLAVHTVSETDLDEGSAGGPCDGYTFTLDGQKYELGQHDYETNNGQVTCCAEVYEVEP
jgi:hypothetical protein